MNRHNQVESKQKGGYQGQRQDWQAQDAELERKLLEYQQSREQSLDCPEHTTFIFLSRYLKEKDQFLYQNLNKLPRTKELVSQLVETASEATIRRIKWAMDCYRQERLLPSETDLLQRAKISVRSYQTYVSVREAIGAALLALAEDLTATQ